MRRITETRDRNKPEFFIIGAPKCGTTALSRYLSWHPDICFAEPKEPQYFCRDFPGYESVDDDDSYLQRYFKHCKKPGQILGEGSATYLYSRIAAQNIVKFNGKSKFIVMIRNPLDLVQSLHSQFVFDGDEDVESLETAWGMQAEREGGRFIPVGCRAPQFLQYAKVASLGEQIERLFTVVPKNQCKLIIFDDFVSDTKKVYESTLGFLGIRSDGRTSFPVINANKRHAYRWLGNLTRRLQQNPPQFLYNAPIARAIGRYFLQLTIVKSKRNEQSVAFKKSLLEELSNDMAKLENMLGRDLSHWRKI